MFEKGITFAGNLDQGARKSQQDSFGFVPPDDLGGQDRLLLLVADGMGGYAGGDVASSEAVAAFVEGFFAREGIPIVERLVEAAYDANERIYELIRVDSSLGGMGTTLVGAYVEGPLLHWVSVGDSPLYLYRNGEVIRLNAEHSMREEMAQKVASGELTEEEAAAHPDRNCLLSALNGHPIEMMDAPDEPFRLFRGDLLIACSDGVLTLDPKRFRKAIEITRDEPAAEVVRRVLRDIRGRRRDTQDNATVAVIKMGDWIEKAAEDGEDDSDEGLEDVSPIVLEVDQVNRMTVGDIAVFEAPTHGSVGIWPELQSQDESILERVDEEPLAEATEESETVDSNSDLMTGADQGSCSFQFRALREGETTILYQILFRGEVEEEHEIRVVVEAL